jgi:hypothetical protein
MPDRKGAKNDFALRCRDFAVTFVPRTRDERKMVPRRGLDLTLFLPIKTML